MRIFRLAPGRFNQPIKGSLITIALDKLRRRKWRMLKQWTALSYVWGSQHQTEDVRISQRIIMVTQNLCDILRYFCHEDMEQYILVDQICINQADFMERGSKVTIMRKIYKQATFVVAWLGSGIDEINPLLESMSFAGSRVNTDIRNKKLRIKRTRKMKSKRLLRRF